jgi:hypothetical protein
VPTTVPSNFAAAGQRHLKDAQTLHQQQRWANADHLSGIAAECGLKAILLQFLGGVPNPRGMPTHPTMPPRHHYGHINSMWSELAATSHGRGGAQFAALISVPCPFTNWDVSERYSDGTHIDEQRAGQHLSEAQKILALHEQAKINGVLP